MTAPVGRSHRDRRAGEKLQVNASVHDGATVVLAKLSWGEFDGHAGRVTLPGESDDAGCVTVLARDVYAKSGSKWIDECRWTDKLRRNLFGNEMIIVNAMR